MLSRHYCPRFNCRVTCRTLLPHQRTAVCELHTPAVGETYTLHHRTSKLVSALIRQAGSWNCLPASQLCSYPGPQSAGLMYLTPACAQSCCARADHYWSGDLVVHDLVMDVLNVLVCPDLKIEISLQTLKTASPSLQKKIPKANILVFPSSFNLLQCYFVFCELQSYNLKTFNQKKLFSTPLFTILSTFRIHFKWWKPKDLFSSISLPWL